MRNIYLNELDWLKFGKICLQEYCYSQGVFCLSYLIIMVEFRAPKLICLWPRKTLGRPCSHILFRNRIAAVTIVAADIFRPYFLSRERSGRSNAHACWVRFRGTTMLENPYLFIFFCAISCTIIYTDLYHTYFQGKIGSSLRETFTRHAKSHQTNFSTFFFFCAINCTDLKP
jgi:hypothetical protein